MKTFNGLDLHLGNLPRLSSAQSRSISAENPDGSRGGGARAEADPTGRSRLLGRGWKCRPYIWIEPNETVTLAEIEDAGAIQSIWTAGPMTRNVVLRMYWDDQEHPSVEVPLPDFFAVPWSLYDAGHDNVESRRGRGTWFAQVNSFPVVVNPRHGVNCFWQMPFRRRCRITLQNIHPTKRQKCYYQINYTLTDVPDDVAYFHAQFRRENPLTYGDAFTIVDGIRGQGHYVGTSMGWGVRDDLWFGEGEIKFFMDGDSEYPTICGTGTEDYFGGAWGWDVHGSYATYTTPFLGMQQVIQPDGFQQTKHRHAMYRFHVLDPIRFSEDLRVTIQALGFHPDREYDEHGVMFLPRQDDISAVAFWYQALPTAPFPTLPDRLTLTNP